MTPQHSVRWQRCDDVAWIGDESRVIAARTSQRVDDGPRVLEGAAAWVWAQLTTAVAVDEIAVSADHVPVVEAALGALAGAGLVEPREP